MPKVVNSTELNKLSAINNQRSGSKPCLLCLLFNLTLHQRPRPKQGAIMETSSLFKYPIEYLESKEQSPL